jgi:hypothetical protein
MRTTLSVDDDLLRRLKETAARELLSGDRDFLRFPGLRVTNPFAVPTRE